LEVREYEFAHPDDRQWWVDQCGFVIAWFREMFGRVRGGDEKAAGCARVALGRLPFLGVKKLTAVALDSNNRSAQWAREVLCEIEVWISKYRGRFGKGYEKERRKLSVVMRNDLWEPKSPLYKALHRELWLCEYYRGEIAFPSAQRYMAGVRPDVVPEEYRPVLSLPPLTCKTLSKWEPKLWELVRQHNPRLLCLLEKRYKRVEVRWSKYRKEFAHHLERIVG
jgi:hypothetical protein